MKPSQISIVHFQFLLQSRYTSSDPEKESSFYTALFFLGIGQLKLRIMEGVHYFLHPT